MYRPKEGKSRGKLMARTVLQVGGGFLVRSAAQGMVEEAGVPVGGGGLQRRGLGVSAEGCSVKGRWEEGRWRKSWGGARRSGQVACQSGPQIP